MSTEYRINENKTPPVSDHKSVWLANLFIFKAKTMKIFWASVEPDV